MNNDAMEHSNPYFINTEDITELARLIDLDQIITQLTGAFPASPADLFPTPGEDRVLDLACGPGGWALEVGYQLPAIEVVGVDISPSMVRYAAMRAATQARENVSFEVMDITKGLTFPDASFTYVNARFLVGFMRPDDWLPLLEDCRRVLAPGGTLCLTESEWPLTNCKAYETLKRLVSKALWFKQQSLSADGHDFGVTALLGPFLRQTGYQHIQHKATAVEWSAGTLLHAASYHQCEAAFTLLRPFVLKAGTATDESYDALYRELCNALGLSSFCAVTTPLTVWGRTPATL